VARSGCRRRGLGTACCGLDDDSRFPGLVARYGPELRELDADAAAATNRISQGPSEPKEEFEDPGPDDRSWGADDPV
jgi:hypothetical protein